MNINRGMLSSEASTIKAIFTPLLGFLLSIQPTMKSTSPRNTTSIPGMSESMPQSPYSSGVRRKAMRPIPIRKKEATISLPNLLTPLVIRFIYHPYPALPLKGEGIVFLSRGAAPLLSSPLSSHVIARPFEEGRGNLVLPAYYCRDPSLRSG